MAQSRYYSANAQPTVLTANITPTSTIIQVAQTVGFPATTPFILALDYGNASEEVVLCTAVAGLSLTVTRGYDGTSATNHNAGAAVRHTWTAMDGNDSRAHEGSTSGVHGVVGNVVGTTDTQTLTNKTLTSPVFTGSVSLNNPAITGTVTGGASYTGITATNPTVTGTVGGSASYTTPTITSPTITGTVGGGATYSAHQDNDLTVRNSAIGTVPLTVNSIAGTTALLADVQLNGTSRLSVSANGQTFANSAVNSTTPLRVNIPTGPTADVAQFQINGVNQVRINTTGTLVAANAFNAGAAAFSVDATGNLTTTGTAAFNGSTVSGTASMKAYAGIGGFNFAFKTANETRTSNTTLTNDTHLVVPVAANVTYILDGYFEYDGTFGPGTSDIKFDWTIPAGASLTWSPFGLANNDTTQKLNTNQGAATSVMPLGTYGTGGSHQTARPFGYLTVAGTSGNLQLRWAQNVSNATAVTMYTGSWIRLQRVA